jgi:hypothetical protein
MDVVVGTSMVVMGLAIAGIWTRDILGGEVVDTSSGLFAARDPDAGTLMWPHWVAEYTTAAILVVGGFGLMAEWSAAETIAGLGLGALFYTSINSLGWALASPDRRPYAAAMLVGVGVAVLGGLTLLVG